MKKTIKTDVLYSEMSDLIALYESRMQSEPAMKEYYTTCIAAVRAALYRVDQLVK